MRNYKKNVTNFQSFKETLGKSINKPLFTQGALNKRLWNEITTSRFDFDRSKDVDEFIRSDNVTLQTMIDYHNGKILNTSTAMVAYTYGAQMKDISDRLSNEQVFEKVLENNENFSGSEYDLPLDTLQNIFTDFKSYQNIDDLKEYYEVSNKTTTEEISESTYKIYGLNYDDDKPEDDDEDGLMKELLALDRGDDIRRR